MDSRDLFSVHRSPKRLNESLQKVFGKKINLENFSLEQLEDARNKLRTQISQVRSSSNFNETVENDAYHQAKFMLDAIVAEIADREQFIADASTAETSYEEGAMKDVDYDLRMLADDGDEGELIVALQGEYGSGVADALNDMMSELQDDLASKGMNDVMNDDDKMIEMLWDKLVDEYGGSDSDEGGETDDDYALASAGFGSDEDYGDFDRDESVQGDDMRRVTEGEIQQAQSIVSAKTMVDRVGRWIEELSGMENDSLLQLGDQIRDEMGQEQAKRFIEAVAPAIQQALDNLKTTRETLSSGVRILTGEEQPAEMLGGEPATDGEEMPAAEPDAMNQEPGADTDLGDEFAAAEPAAGGGEAAGREQRESIQFQNRLLKVLAG
jgi:hypothetical protein